MFEVAVCCLTFRVCLLPVAYCPLAPTAVEGCQLWSVVCRLWSVVCGPWSFLLWSVVRGPWSFLLWSVVRGPWSVVRGPWSSLPLKQSHASSYPFLILVVAYTNHLSLTQSSEIDCGLWSFPTILPQIHHPYFNLCRTIGSFNYI